jgi:Flp pilus assembly protein TadB
VGPGAVFLVASVDIVGEETETHVAYSLRRIENALRQNEHIEEALLSLSTPDEPSLLPALK